MMQFQVSLRGSILIMIIFCENHSVWVYIFLGEAWPLKYLLRVDFAHLDIKFNGLLVFVAL